MEAIRCDKCKELAAQGYLPLIRTPYIKHIGRVSISITLYADTGPSSRIDLCEPCAKRILSEAGIIVQEENLAEKVKALDE